MNDDARMTLTDPDTGGFLIPEQFNEDVVRLITEGSSVVVIPTSSHFLSTEELCKLRGVEYIPETEDEVAERRAIIRGIKEHFEFKRRLRTWGILMALVTGTILAALYWSL